VLVTGGGGFLGGAVVRGLLARGDDVVSVARGDYPALRELGVETQRGDLAEPAVAERAAEGCEAVVHVAALAGMWGPTEAYERSNVEATRSVLAACRTVGVRRLVFTSTPSVVHAGQDIVGGDERLPYATHFTTDYPRTKAVAERLVLAAADDELGTVALRPHLVWGPEDTQLIPRILSRARSGRLRFVGGGDAVFDTTFVDDAVAAHLCALDRIAPGRPARARRTSSAPATPVRSRRSSTPSCPPPGCRRSTGACRCPSRSPPAPPRRGSGGRCAARTSRP
jgi:nucleoside-diphosphate-sugar epimerase